MLLCKSFFGGIIFYFSWVDNSGISRSAYLLKNIYGLKDNREAMVYGPTERWKCPEINPGGGAR